MKKVLIVGAGIAGLSAGIYARQSGFDVTILEGHTIPGGASTSWRRKGYLFEGGMHWLTGSSPQTELHALWREVGALDDSVRVYNRDPFTRMELGGTTVCLYRDVDRLRQHFLEIAPEDGAEIKRLCRDIAHYQSMGMPVTDLKGLRVQKRRSQSLAALPAMLAAMPRLSFYAGLTVGEYAARFQNPALRQALESVVGADYVATSVVFTLATYAAGDGGYPEGGSLAIARRMADKFVKLGGAIRYNTPVRNVIVRDGAAVGVELEGGAEEADAVIVTQDTLAAVDRLFDPPIREPWVERMKQTTVPSLNTFLSIGVEANLADLPESVQFEADVPLTCGGIEQRIIGINNYSTYPGYALAGCTALTAFFGGDTYEFWKTCRENGTYAAEKEKLAMAFIDLLARKYPQTAGKVAVWDVATPLTYERYLHSYKGSWMTIMGKGMPAKPYPCKPEGIRNVYFAGQRLRAPGGLPVALTTGRTAAQHLCLDTDTVFQGAT